MIETIQRQIARNPVIQAFTVLVGAWLAWQLRELIVLVFIAFVISLAVKPLVQRLRSLRVPGVIAVLLPLLMLALVVGYLTWRLAPLAVQQATAIVSDAPEYLREAGQVTGLQLRGFDAEQLLRERAQDIGTTAIGLTTLLAHVGLSAITVMVISFFILLDYAKIRNWLLQVAGWADQSRLAQVFDRVESRLGAWVRGQLLLSASIGVLSFVVYLWVGLPYALTLALLAAILEVVPMLGPILAGIPAALIALSISPVKALMVVIGYLVIQFIEANILAPKIMSASVGLHPLAVLLFLVAGGQLAGLPGVFLALPLALLVIAVAETLKEQRRATE